MSALQSARPMLPGVSHLWDHHMTIWRMHPQLTHQVGNSQRAQEAPAYSTVGTNIATVVSHSGGSLPVSAAISSVWRVKVKGQYPHHCRHHHHCQTPHPHLPLSQSPQLRGVIIVAVNQSLLRRRDILKLITSWSPWSVIDYRSKK